MTPEQFHVLETCASQIALAIERDQLAEKARQAQVQAETERSRNTLLSSVSHDLRTPLAAICGASSSLLSQSANLNEHAQRELLHTIDDEGNRLARLVSNLLEMTRLESGTIELKRELCPIEEVVGSALSRMEARLKDRHVKADLPGGLPPLMLDVVMMEQVFINLLDNAAKHTPDGTGIELSAEASDKEMLVRVADHGPGIDEGDRQRVFEKFYRGGAAPRPGGVGLGLAICRTIVEAHGGRISVADAPGGGAVFTIALPITAQDATGRNSNHP
jgi:two-component system sensor histidine kinase KdpD